jgi:NADH-quinone oxidoreductase subunit C
VSEAVVRRIADRFGEKILRAFSQHGDEAIVVAREDLVEIARFCHDDEEIDLEMPVTLTCVDYIGEKPRFELVYVLYSVKKKHRLQIRVRVPEEDPEAPSLTPIYRGLDYWERYVWDMYGIRFSGRLKPLKRLWMWEEFEGHPLRKDFPLRGRTGQIPELDIRDIYRGPGPGPTSRPASRAAEPRPSQLPIVK